MRPTRRQATTRSGNWHARRFDAVLHLDSIVSMLTLGQQGIVRDGLREQLQPAAVAVAFTLYPRRAGDGGKAAAEDQ